MTVGPLEPAEEDALVALWAGRDDPEALAEAVGEALGQRRLRLAARLVGLLDPTEGEAPELARARRAAALLLVEGGADAAARAQDLEASWTAAHRRLVLRGRRRQRERIATSPDDARHRGRRR